MDSKGTARLTEGPVGATLVRLTIHMLPGIVAMVAFNLVDTYFVGKLGTKELAAMGFILPVVLVVGGLALGLGMGASAVIARAIGRGDRSEVRRLTTDSLLLALVIVFVCIVVGMLNMDWIFRRLNASDDVLPLIRQYMVVWFPGMIFVVVPMVGNNAIRATGDMKTPSIIMMVAVAVNCVLDPLLIFGIGPFPRMELAGAALATVFARATAFCVSTYVLYHRDKMITFARVGLGVMWRSWKRILYIGVPSGATHVIMPVGLGVVTSLVAGYGPEGVAAFGVGFRVDMFAQTILMALMTVLGPFVGQNWGAGRHDRVRAAVRASQGFALAYGLGTVLVLALTGRMIGGLFDHNPEVVSTIALYLMIVPVSYGMQGVLRLSYITLNVLHRPLLAAGLMFVHTFALMAPLAWAGSHFFGMGGLLAGFAGAPIISGVLAYLCLRRVLARSEEARAEEIEVTGVEEVLVGRDEGGLI